MIRKTRSIVLLAIILVFSFLLSISVYYQGDTYRAFSFNMDITEIRLVKNETSGVYHRIEVRVHMDNPSQTTPLHFAWTDTRILLNGQSLYYGFGIKGHQFYLLPGESHDFGWHYSTPEQDWDQLQEAETTETWNWYLYQEPYVEAGFLGRTEVIRINLYEGVTIITI